MSDPHRSFVRDFHAHRLVDPNRCVSLGVDARLDDLPDPSLAACCARIQSARALLERARALSRDPELESLSFDERLDLDLATSMLEREVHDGTYHFNELTTLQQLPTAGDDISQGLFSMFVNDPRPAEERLVNITSRLEMVPEYVEALLRRLTRPIERWVDIDRKKVAGLSDLFENLERWGEREGFSDLPRLRAAKAQAETALADYVARLSALPTSRNIHVGEATARRIVELRGIRLGLETLHQVARDFLFENRRVVGELGARLAVKYGLGKDATVREVHEHLNGAFAVRLEEGDLDGILRRYEEERDRVVGFLDDRRLFPIPENQAMKIIRTPRFLEPTIPAGAMMPPPPFREGVRTSLVYLTLSEALLDEHTELGIPGMIIHEGIPGHHLQLASAAMHPSIIRRHVDAMEQAEGWTTMLEDYMLDLGYMGQLTDEARFVGKLDISRIGARVGIDLFFMTGNRDYLDLGVPDVDLSPEDPFEVAGRLLQAVTGFTPGRVEAELNWYSIDRGYPLSYLTGNHLVWKLKTELAEAQAGKLSGDELDRVFHRVFLESGNMPLDHLRRVFVHQGWL